jgi:hypothetical protein
MIPVPDIPFTGTVNSSYLPPIMALVTDSLQCTTDGSDPGSCVSGDGGAYVCDCDTNKPVGSSAFLTLPILPNSPFPLVLKTHLLTCGFCSVNSKVQLAAPPRVFVTAMTALPRYQVAMLCVAQLYGLCNRGARWNEMDRRCGKG